MPDRTNDAKVIKVLGHNYNRKSSLEPFIEWANLIMIDVEACAVGKGTPLSAAKSASMATFLAAHAYCAQDPVYISRSTISASGSFQRRSNGQGLEATEFGSLALSLDSTGCLAAAVAGGELSADASWTGTRDNLQSSYEDWADLT